MLTQSLPIRMPPWASLRRQTASILTLEIISRLRLIFRFYKTLHFSGNPVSDPCGMPAGEPGEFAPVVTEAGAFDSLSGNRCDVDGSASSRLPGDYKTPRLLYPPMGWRQYREHCSRLASAQDFGVRARPEGPAGDGQAFRAASVVASWLQLHATLHHARNTSSRSDKRQETCDCGSRRCSTRRVHMGKRKKAYSFARSLVRHCAQ